MKRWALRICLFLLLGAIVNVAAGCNRAYRLPGHTEDNLNQPPNVTLREGDRVKAISTGIVLLELVPASMKSSDPNIVEVDMPNHDTTFLIARRLGSATVKYGWVPGNSPNLGFVVQVVPRE